jgi:hypothetical protein
MTETQMHYVKQLFFGLSEELQQFMIKDLESQLTLEQIEESKQTSEQIYSILSKVDSLLLSHHFGQENQSHQSANLNFLYCEHLLNTVDDDSVPVFIDLLEMNFTKKALNGFMLVAAQKTLGI